MSGNTWNYCALTCELLLMGILIKNIHPDDESIHQRCFTNRLIVAVKLVMVFTVYDQIGFNKIF